MTSLIDKIRAKLKEDLEIEAIITPGPWKLDMGNWQVESQHQDRYRDGVCAIDWESRDRLNGDTNPVDPYVDGEFISHARNTYASRIKALEKAIKALQFASEAIQPQESSAKALKEIAEILGVE